MATKAQILALPAKTFPRIGRASDSGEWYIIAANALGSTAQKFGPEIAASLAASGIVELATIAEADTGTDTTRAVTPSGLAGSALQTKINETANKIGNIASLTLIGDATNSVKAYSLDEWAAYGVIDANWQLNATTLTSLHIGQGVTSIGESAFDGCAALVGNLVIPSSVTAIGASAFDSCGELNGTLTLNEGLLTIGADAFDNCEKLTGHLTIPNSVTSIGDGAFDENESLTGLTLGSGLTSIADTTFEDCESIAGTLVIPDGITSIGTQSFEGCSSITGLTLGSGLLTIGEDAFLSCRGLTDLTIPSSVTSIGTTAFKSCIGMTTVTCHTTRTAMNGINCLLLSNVSTIVADAGKGWTAGSDTIGGRAVTVTIAP